VLYPLMPLECWLLALDTRPTVGIVELRRVARLLLSGLPLGLVFDEVLADLTPSVIGCVLQLTIGTLQLLHRQFDALGRLVARGCFMLTGTFHAGRCDVAVRAVVTPLLTATVLGWSVALGIVIHPVDNDVVDGLGGACQLS
jgi:hypothetical protein